VPGDHRDSEDARFAEGRLTRRSRTRLSNHARRWLIEEISYLSKRNAAAAARVADACDAAWERIARYPEIGPEGDLPGTRIMIVGAYVVTLRARDGVVEIIAIRHGRQADARAPKDLADDGETGSP
jgi:plasmid stabilization system protein ParE